MNPRKRTFVILTVLFVILTVGIMIFISSKNDIASGDSTQRDYLAFNWSVQTHSQHIMQYWRASKERVDAVKTIAYLDYLFMIVYGGYLIYCLFNFRDLPRKRWLKGYMKTGVALVALCVVLDAIQDTKILHYVTSQDAVDDMRYYTRFKWLALFLGVLPLILLLFHHYGNRLLRFIGRLTASIWLFFPAFLFLFLVIFCFWMMGQGKDIIVAFKENKPGNLLNYNRLVFFLAIGFWVYVSWYSGRIIAYIKKAKQLQQIRLLNRDTITHDEEEKRLNNLQHYFQPNEGSLDNIPRIIGNGCFLVLELAVLQSPLFLRPLPYGAAWVILIVCMVAFYYLNKWIRLTDQPFKPYFEKLFYALLVLLVVLIFVASIPKELKIGVLLILLLLFHVVYILYINLRVKLMKRKQEAPVKFAKPVSSMERIMNYFYVPPIEKGYYRWFFILAAAGICLYILSIIFLGFARHIGPFPFIILAFSVLLSFGNIVTAFSVRARVNFHFLLFLSAFIIGSLHETHEVRKINLDKVDNGYANRPDLKTYLKAWLRDRHVSSESGNTFNIYFVMSNGGASRSGYWTAGVLGKIQDSSMIDGSVTKFSDHVFCLSGTSGGGVGVATFFSLLQKKDRDTTFDHSAKAFLKQDYFTYTLARMLGPDFFSYMWPTWWPMDRGGALESSFEKSAGITKGSRYEVPFYDSMSHFPALTGDSVFLPILFVNTTRMQDGNPGVVSNLKIDSTYNNRVDVLGLLEKDEDISLASGAILGARFPYLSPAGRIADNYFVDGGYFDNSGSGVVQETIRGILNVVRYDTLEDDREMINQIKNLHFKVIHIVNSPINLDSTNIKKVPPIKNDLLSPVLTIVGAYDMQTTVNDRRLIHFLQDLNKFPDSTDKADYTQLSLYKDTTEWKADRLYKPNKIEPSYAMNWFMSDTTRRRIDLRMDSVVAKFYSRIWDKK